MSYARMMRVLVLFLLLGGASLQAQPVSIDSVDSVEKAKAYLLSFDPAEEGMIDLNDKAKQPARWRSACQLLAEEPVEELEALVHHTNTVVRTTAWLAGLRNPKRWDTFLRPFPRRVSDFGLLTEVIWW